MDKNLPKHGASGVKRECSINPATTEYTRALGFVFVRVKFGKMRKISLRCGQPAILTKWVLSDPVR